MSALLRRARPLSWVRTAERRAASLNTLTQGRRPFGTVKVILTDDVAGTGYRGEHVEIRGGFMRNFLFPGRRAVYATEENRLMFDSADGTPDKERAEALKALKRGRQEMSGIPIILKRGGRTDGGVQQTDRDVTAKDVSGYLRKVSPFEVTVEEVQMPRGVPIDLFGVHPVLVRTKLSETATAILEEELGRKELEAQAWVEMKVHVEKMGGSGRRKQQENFVEGDDVEDSDDVDIDVDR